MSTSHLIILPSPTEAESAGKKIQRLQAEARNLAREHVEQLSAALADVSRLAAEIAEGGDLYPVGARELARRLVDDAAKQSMSLSAILERS
ncbi:MAG TPA: hypothetical protein VMU93_11115 [Caulobacteraceae bacterium]|nr:hypothetical protein [Caulobacteraceae bacterium]